MESSSGECPEHLIALLAAHLTPGAVDPHEVFGKLDCSDHRAVEVAIAHAYREYPDQSWASTVADLWISSFEQEASTPT